MIIQGGTKISLYKEPVATRYYITTRTGKSSDFLNRTVVSDYKNKKEQQQDCPYSTHYFFKHNVEYHLMYFEGYNLRLVQDQIYKEAS